MCFIGDPKLNIPGAGGIEGNIGSIVLYAKLIHSFKQSIYHLLQFIAFVHGQ